MDLIGIDFSYNSLIEQLSTPMILILLQLGYDMTVDNYNFSQARYDALLMFGSLFASKILSNAFIAKMVGKLRNSYGTSITGKLTEPILNYFIYRYLYENQFKKSQIGFKEKSSQELMLTPIVQALLSTAIDGFVISWISGKNPDYVL